MGSSCLPQELVDIVLDNLHDDIPSLRSCSLSARTFVISARIHIFQKIEILPPASPTSSPNACQRFYKLLTSSPHIAPLVEELSIVLVDPDTTYDLDGDNFNDRRVPWVMDDRTLFLVLPLLDLKRISLTENLQAHRIHSRRFSMNWDHMDRQLKSALMKTFSSPRLETVHLRGIVIESPRQLLSLVSEATSLKELSLSRFYFTQPAHQHESWPESQPWRPQLRSLLISDFQSRDFCRHLVNPRMDLTAVRSLSLAVYATDSEWRDRLIRASKAGSGGVEHLRYWTMTGADSQKLSAQICAPSTSSPTRYSSS
ncbi:hypothetical protein B0H19DRAFT_681672 [Mycena capillaripes]|nr:hypothetical protein B0H19DRAFT_681672 [Mycena capillaripes]